MQIIEVQNKKKVVNNKTDKCNSNFKIINNTILNHTKDAKPNSKYFFELINGRKKKQAKIDKHIYNILLNKKINLKEDTVK